MIFTKTKKNDNPLRFNLQTSPQSPERVNTIDKNQQQQKKNYKLNQNLCLTINNLKHFIKFNPHTDTHAFLNRLIFNMCLRKF